MTDDTTGGPGELESTTSPADEADGSAQMSDAPPASGSATSEAESGTDDAAASEPGGAAAVTGDVEAVAAAVAAAAEPPPPTGIIGYFKHRPDPLTSLVLTIPIFLIYHLGILLIDKRNGVDLISSLAFGLLERSQAAYMGVTVAFCAGIAIAVWALRRTGKLQPVALLPIVIESTLLAVLMTVSIGWATQQLTQGAIVALQLAEDPRALGPIEKLVMAAGAGFHEELVFRAIAFAGLAWLLAKALEWPKWRAALVAALVSSLLFSAVHYIGELGDDFTISSFTFRFLTGIYLAGVYKYRGFAVAVYTHAIYDMMVFFIFT